MDDKKLIQEIEANAISYMTTPSENMLDKRFFLDSFREIESPENVLRLVELAKKGFSIKWTKEKPTVPGFYGLRSSSSDKACVVEVWRDNQDGLSVFYPGDEVEKEFWEIADAEWFGPIRMPRGVKDE